MNRTYTRTDLTIHAAERHLRERQRGRCRQARRQHATESFGWAVVIAVLLLLVTNALSRLLSTEGVLAGLLLTLVATVALLRGAWTTGTERDQDGNETRT